MEISTLVKPDLPADWDYEKSVKTIQHSLYSWKNLTENMLRELWIAREKLSQTGVKKSDPRWNESSTLKTWTDYCDEIGSSRQVVNRWLQRYFEPKPEPIPEPEQDLDKITNKEFNKAYRGIKRIINQLRLQGWPEAPSHLVKSKIGELFNNI